MYRYTYYSSFPSILESLNKPPTLDKLEWNNMILRRLRCLNASTIVNALSEYKAVLSNGKVGFYYSPFMAFKASKFIYYTSFSFIFVSVTKFFRVIKFEWYVVLL